MIYKHRIKSLNEDELAILLYCLNSGHDNEAEWSFTLDKLPFIRMPYIVNSLQFFGGNLTKEKKDILQKIMDKLSKSL